MANTLRILSYNIHKGFTLGNRKFILGGIKEAIRLVQPDLVFLQEVLGHHEKHAESIEEWPSTPQFEFLADEVWPHYAYGKNAVYLSGHHGNAILSRFPIEEWHNIDVSCIPFESRGLLHVKTRIPESGQLVHCICVHLSLLQKGREQQLRSLVEQIQRTIAPHEPLVIAGDFNDLWQRASRSIVPHLGVSELFQRVNGRYARTFPSRFPLLRLDRIYFRGFTPVCAEALTGAPWEQLSDHAALYGEIRFGEDEDPTLRR